MLRPIEIHIEVDASWKLLEDTFSHTYSSDQENWKLVKYAASHPDDPYFDDEDDLHRYIDKLSWKVDAQPRFDVPADINAVFRTVQDRNKERSKRAESTIENSKLSPGLEYAHATHTAEQYALLFPKGYF